jgi:hypothetical protein
MKDPMKTTRNLRGLALWLLLTPLVAGAAAPAPDKLLPADALGLITVPDYARASATWNAWPASGLWSDPALKPFVDKFKTKWKADLMAPLEREFGVKFADYAGLAQGQLTLALMPGAHPESKDDAPGFLLLVDTRDKAETLRKNLADLKKKWVDSGKQIRAEKIRDVEFTALIFMSDDFSKTLKKAFPDPNEGYETKEPAKPKKAPRKVEWLVGQSDSLFIVGSAAKDIEKVLSRQGGGGVKGLGEVEAFASAYNSQFRDSLGYGWLNVKVVVDALTKAWTGPGGDEQGEGRSNRPQPGKVMNALGLNGVQYLSFNLQDVKDTGLVNLHINVPEAGRKGLFKILAHSAKDAAPLPFVPADAVKFTRWRLDIQKSWAALEAMVAEISPQAAGGIKMLFDMAGKDKDPDFDLRKSLLGNLGDDIITYQKNPRKPTLQDMQSPPGMWLLSSPRAEQLASAIKAIASLLPPQAAGKFKEREFLGRKVYSLPLVGMGGPPGGGRRQAAASERTLHFSASGGYLALSTDVALLEEYVRGAEAKALRDLPGLNEAAQKVGGMGTGLFGFENQAETMRSTLEILKKESGTLANLLGGSPLADRFGLGEEGNKLKDWVDFSLLPPFEKISKYFYLSVWSGVVNADGLSLKVYAPPSPQLRK